MKQIVVITFVSLSQIAFGQGILNLKDSAAFYFKEIKAATKKTKKLWNEDLYGPILIVDPVTRSIASNYQDSAGALKKDGEIFTGILPSKFVMANYSFHWNGKDWAMVSVLPAYKIDKHDIVGLFGHELFHKAQPSPHFPRTNNPDNNHLDKKNGRIYLRLEPEALSMAANSNSSADVKRHLTNAFIFRKYRYMLYPGADISENVLELNEGMAEYTGYVVSGRNKKEAIQHFEEQKNKFILNTGYVRTFAYNTIPVYGFLLRKKERYWNHDIKAETNLTDYFIKKFA